MKMCFPTMGKRGLEEEVEEYIRLVPTFTFYDTETSRVKVLENNFNNPEFPENLVRTMMEMEVDILILVDIETNLAGSFEREGILVYRGAHGNVDNAIEMYEHNMLEPINNELLYEQYLYQEGLYEQSF